jgi:glycosyltransferase involved in cell wall biosynthesis
LRNGEFTSNKQFESLTFLMKIIIAICTWNRAKLLDQTLAQMHKLHVPEGVEWELLVVNNNCTDDTDATVQRHASSLPIRLLHEPRPGKSFAANLALEQARGDLLIWTDDDVLVEPNWLAAYAQAARDCPDASFFAGAIRPWFEKEPPRWIHRHMPSLNGVYVCADYGSRTRPWTPNSPVFGANMAFRTEVARAFPLNPLLGRICGELIGGDDTELIQRVVQAGHKGVCLPDACVRHFVPAHRLNGAYVWKWYRGAGRNLVRQGTVKPCPTTFAVPRWVLRQFASEYAAAFAFSPFKGVRWFHAFTQAARLWGIIREIRNLRQERGDIPFPPLSSPLHSASFAESTDRP